MPSVALRPTPPTDVVDGAVDRGEAAPRAAGRRLPWPLPALLAWTLAWGAWLVLQPPLGAAAAAGVALSLGAALAATEHRRVRRAALALGFPLSALALGAAAHWPGWIWALPLAALWLAYPLRGWRDAPLFPTPPGALDALAARLPLPAGARVLDAGCGVGDGLRALRRAWPQAAVEGIELSRPWAALAARRCRWARVRRGDLWASSWRGLALVYLFQRPESMARAWAKAEAELAPGAWLVSLEFAVPGRAPALSIVLPGGRAVHAWRIGAAAAGAAALKGATRAPISPSEAPIVRRAAPSSS